MDISSILPLLAGMNGGGSDASSLMGALGGNQGGDMSAILGAMGGMQGNNGLAGMMSMLSGMQNTGEGNMSQGGSVEKNSASEGVGNTGNESNQMMNMLPLLLSMMNGGTGGNASQPVAEDIAPKTAYENASSDNESDINYKIYKLLQEQVRKGV